MIYKISNKGRTVMQCQLIGGEAINIQPGSLVVVDESKVFKREFDRLNNRPGVSVIEFAKTHKEALDKIDEEIKSRNKLLQDANKKAGEAANKKAEDDAKKAAEKKKKEDEEAAVKNKKEEEDAAAKAKADEEARKKAEKGGNK